VRHFFHIGFHGYNYRGWQRQAKTLNVQGVIETTLSKILKVPITCVGCGRTDAQVHASQFFFHVDIEQDWGYDLIFRVNKMLPLDIAVFDIIRMNGSPHARLDATGRTYDYFIHTYKDPFLSGVSAFYPDRSLDLNKMKEASALLPRYDDYRAFCTTPDRHRTTISRVTSAILYGDVAGDKIRFQISSNRFLSRMIRIIVGKLLEIGRRELSVDEFEQYLISRRTPETIEPVYPQGLYLSRVIYPFLDVPPRTEFLSVLDKVEQWQLI
jgi:tRNA pseudouridine38-40 synthase